MADSAEVFAVILAAAFAALTAAAIVVGITGGIAAAPARSIEDTGLIGDTGNMAFVEKPFWSLNTEVTCDQGSIATV